MNPRMRVLSLVVASGAAVGIATSVSLAEGGGVRAASDKATPKLQLSVAVFEKKGIEGIVSVARRGRRPTARLSVSLHGHKPGAGYRLVGSRQPCSKEGTPSNEEADVADVAFSLNFEEIRSVVLEDVVVTFGTPRVPMNGSLRTVKSTRVYGPRPGGGHGQLACSGNEVAIETLE